MPWYYAGPEAKPVGPVSLEELQSLRARGTVSAETFVIEQTGEPPGSLSWKRYKEFFPDLPPMPRPTPLPPPPMAPHSPLPPGAVFVPAHRPDPYYHVKPTNPWCAWGFGLSLAAIFFAFVCGIGILPALASIPLCIIGLTQLPKHRDQGGQWFAIWGLVLSTLALVIALFLIIWMSMPYLKAHGLTVTEQTTNDSE